MADDTFQVERAQTTRLLGIGTKPSDAPQGSKSSFLVSHGEFLDRNRALSDDASGEHSALFDRGRPQAWFSEEPLTLQNPSQLFDAVEQSFVYGAQAFGT